MEFSAQQIADFLKGTVVGDSSVKVNNLSKIEAGIPGTLTFLANPKYEQYIYTTKASIVLVNNTFEPQEKINATLIKVDDAYKSLSLLLNLVEQTKPQPKGISELAYIASSAKIEEDISSLEQDEKQECYHDHNIYWDLAFKYNIEKHL